jgi:kynurenine formamidase
VDAPYHFIKNGKKIHQINPERFVCNAILIRVRGTANYKITKNLDPKFYLTMIKDIK